MSMEKGFGEIRQKLTLRADHKRRASTKLSGRPFLCLSESVEETELPEMCSIVP